MVDVKGIRIGTGKPKICVPIVSRDAEGIIESARLIAMSQADLAEWRADLFEGHGDTVKVMEVLRSLRNALGDKPLMFTLRSAQEGGGSNLSGEQAARLLMNAAASGNTDLLDIEMFSYGGLLRMAVDSAKGCGVSVVGSYHDFYKTPDKSEIISRLVEIHASGADISKIAVMPNSRRDVFNLLDAALIINEKNPEITLVCISMSGIGALSRLTGEFFGSSLTFAAIGEGSAPGQIGIESLATVQDVLHSSLE